MPDIPPKPQLILASLDTPGDACWWLRVADDWCVRCDRILPNILPVRVLLSRLIPVKADHSIDAGDWRAVRDCHAARLAGEASD